VKLELRPAAGEIPNGVGLQLTLFAVGAQGRSELIPGHRAAWVSSAPAIAEVNRQGRVSPRRPGAVTITATHDGKTAQATLTVV
jgi:hypothetical protein